MEISFSDTSLRTVYKTRLYCQDRIGYFNKGVHEIGLMLLLKVKAKVDFFNPDRFDNPNPS